MSVSFATRSFQVVDLAGGVRDVVLGTVVTVADARALADALAWQRSRDYLAAPVESADAVVALRRIVVLIDRLEALASGEEPGPITLSRDDVALLAEAAMTFVAERDRDDEYVPPPERERIAALSAISGALFDATADFAGAIAELEAQTRAPGR